MFIPDPDGLIWVVGDMYDEADKLIKHGGILYIFGIFFKVLLTIIMLLPIWGLLLFFITL